MPEFRDNLVWRPNVPVRLVRLAVEEEVDFMMMLRDWMMLAISLEAAGFG